MLLQMPLMEVMNLCIDCLWFQAIPKCDCDCSNQIYYYERTSMPNGELYRSYHIVCDVCGHVYSTDERTGDWMIHCDTWSPSGSHQCCIEKGHSGEHRCYCGYVYEQSCCPAQVNYHKCSKYSDHEGAHKCTCRFEWSDWMRHCLVWYSVGDCRCLLIERHKGKHECECGYHWR